MIEAIDTCLGGCTKEKVIQLLEDGPLISVIDGYTPEFDLYSSGILNYTCLQKNHAVILIGYVKNITDEYFIIRNSYGSNWGENGEANIQVKSSDLSCFIETYAFQPKLIPIQPNPPPKCIKLFQNCSYQGTFLEICNNTQNITIPVNSFTNPTYEATTYFTKPNCDGVSYTFNTENICLSNSIYKTLSSNIRSIVFPNQDLPKLKCIKVYEQTCVSGNVFEICADSPDLGSMQISSIRVLKQTGSYVTVTAYTGTNYTGISTTITSNRYILSSTFDKKIKSLKFNW
jgi:hypothetical protein